MVSSDRVEKMSYKRMCDGCENEIGVPPYTIKEFTQTGVVSLEEWFDLCSLECVSNWAIARGQK